jgi:hypothetical protein
MKSLSVLPRLVLPLFLSASALAESVSNLDGWSIEGGVVMDAAKPGPGGAPSIRLDPKSQATLKLREQGGSGKLSFSVYDDGAVASPGKKRATGPRWGTSDASGRVLVGGIMYAPYLQPEGSLCLVDTQPGAENAWLAVKFVSPREKPGWKKWEFNFDPSAGLIVTVNGKPVAKKYFDWNTSKAEAFNGVVLFGDSTPEATAQTVWIADINYELGPPMAAIPTPAPILPSAPKGPAPEEETEKSATPILGKMAGFIPGPTLLDDLKNLKVPLAEGYAAQHPRLLFTPGDRAELQKRSEERADLWKAVVASAQRLQPEESLPTPEVIRSGAKYWRIERVQSAALAWFVTGKKEYSEPAIRWMVAHCQEPVWGDTYRPNLDLVASWYLYHIAIGYDILKSEMSGQDRVLVRDGLAAHARFIYAEMDPHDGKRFSYDQNHTYIPTVGMAAAALALLEEVPDAKYWLTRSYGVLRRSRYVQNEDGYYYEGIGYWTYALNWHARGAELLARATGEKLFDLPVLRDTWRFGLHLSLPGKPGAFGVGDSGSWSNGKLNDLSFNNYSMLWEVASQAGSGESRTVADLYAARQPDNDYPATAFLWFNPKVEPVPLDRIKPYHYFADQDVIAWRSGWDAGATSYLFRCGPPLGHKAAAKLGQLKDWRMNCGHVHPDIGAFWIYAKGAYLAVDTGYTAAKFTADHNTLLVDGKGQGKDGTYHNDLGFPYASLDKARINEQYLSAEYGFATGEFGGPYDRPDLSLRRSLLMKKDWLLVIDDMEAKTPSKLTWLCHTLAEFQKTDAAWVARQEQAALAVVPLAPAGLEIEPTPTIVRAGTAPGPGTAENRGFKLAMHSPGPAEKVRFINLLLPLGAEEKVPRVELVKDAGNAVSLRLQWADGKKESVTLDLGWKSGGTAGPATFQ